MSTTQVKSEEDQNMADTDSGVESTASASTSTTSIDQNASYAKQRKELFYDISADRSAKFTNGDQIKFHGASLSLESAAFFQIFTSCNEIIINDFDSETFQLFLDCLMGFKNYTVPNALRIFPIACTYEVLKCIDKCVEVLKRTKLTRNMCLALNLALCYKCDQLAKYIIDDLLVKRLLIQKVFYVQKYCFLLEPESVSALLSKTKLDLYLIELVIKWGQNYIKEKNKDTSLRTLFTAYKIIDNIKLEYFRDVASILKFHDLTLGLNFFTPLKILQRIKEIENNFSEWVNVKKNETITEIFFVDCKHCLIDLDSFALSITRNEIVFYEFPFGDETMITWGVFCYKLDSEKNNTYGEDEEKSGNVEKLSSCNEKCFSFFNLNKKYFNFGAENLKIEIKYKFWYDCRIKKASFRPQCFGAKFFEKDPNDLCFTKDIVLKNLADKASGFKFNNEFKLIRVDTFRSKRIRGNSKILKNPYEEL